MSFELNTQLAARREPLATSATVDPVTAAIIRGAFETVCFEAATHLGRAASSPIINQSNERNGSIIDAHGRLDDLVAESGEVIYRHAAHLGAVLHHQDCGVARVDRSRLAGPHPDALPVGARTRPVEPPGGAVAAPHEP